MVDGLFPPSGFRSFNTAVTFNVAFCILRSLGSAFVFDVADRQPQRLQRSSIVRELLPVTGSFTHLGVERFDRVGSVEHSPRRWRELQKRHEPLLCITPDFDRLGVFPAKFTGGESIQAGTCGVLVSGCVDLTQCAGDCFAVLVGHPPVRSPNQVHHAGLHHGIRPGCLHGFRRVFELVAAHDEHVLDTAVGQIRTHRCPECGAFIVSDLQSQDVLDAVHVDTNHHVAGLVDHPVAVTYLDA